jgi:EmrB/QacA subfamily drug resistance transporter
MDAAAIYARRWWTLTTLCLSLLVIGVDNTILNVALPTLVRDLHATNSQLQWIVDGYVLVFAGLLLTAGSLGDRFGRKSTLSIGLVVFAIGSGLSALAGSPNHLIATRALMGIGGALIMPSTLSILTNVFTVPSERARAIAIWASFTAVGIAAGPIIGGWLLNRFSWGAVFTVNLPICAVAFLMGRFLVPNSKDPSAPKLDPVGAVLSIAGLTALLWAIIEAPSHGWTSGGVLGAFALAAIVLGSFVVWELHSTHPMLDVAFFKNPRFTAASSAITLTFLALFGSIFLLTQYLQFVLGYTALQAGIRVAPHAFFLMIGAPLSTRLVERVGTKRVVTFGLLTVTGGLLLFSTATVSSGYPIVFAAMSIMGIGMGFTMAPATESIMGSLPRDKAGVGSAVNDTTRQVGGALGVAVLGSLLASTYGSSVTSALRSTGVPVPAAAINAAQNSVGAAMELANRIGGAEGNRIATEARAAFVHGMHGALLAAAGIAFLGALIVFLFLPARAIEPEELPGTVAELEPALA